MALQVEKGVFSLGTGTGDLDVTLVDSGLTPKAVILWASWLTTPGIINGDGIFSFGMGTRDGGASQQVAIGIFDDDATTSSATVRSQRTDAVLLGLTVDSATEATAEDYRCSLVSFSAGSFRINKSNAPNIDIAVHYMVLGGDDITGARVGEFAASIAAATQDVTVNTGFGQPDLLIFAGHGGASDFQQTDARFYLGFGKSNTERAAMGLHIEDASNTMSLAANVASNRVLHMNGTGTGIDGEADLSAKASWPTDGFQLAWTNQGSIAGQYGYLALRGDFTATIGLGEMLTAGSTQDHALASGTPKGALAMTVEVPLTPGTQDTTHADLGGICVGGMDGTREGFAGLVQDDGNGDSRASRFHSDSKFLARHIADAAGGAATLDAECDATFSGANLRLTWGDLAALAADYIYIIFGEPSAAQQVNITTATQPNAAQALIKNKALSIALASQAMSAQALKVPKLTPALSASLAVALDPDKSVVLSVASQPATAQALDADKYATLGVAAQASIAQALPAYKSMTIAFATSVNTAIALTFDQGGPIEMTLTPAVQSNAAQPLDADKYATLTVATQANTAQALTEFKTVTITAAAQSMTAQTFTKFKSTTLPVASSPSSAQALDKDKTLGITSASQTMSAQALNKVKAPTLPVATQPNLALTFSMTEFANISPATQPSAAQALQKSKNLFIPVASSTSTARDLRVPKLTPAIQQSFAVALSIGDLQFFNLTPAVQSSTAQPLIKNKTVVITFAVTPQSAQTLTGRKFATLAFATSPQAAQTLTAFKRTSITPASVAQSAQALSLSRHATILPALQASLAQALSGHKRATLTPAVTTNIAVELEIEGLTTFVTFSGSSVLTSHQGLAAGTVDFNADGDADSSVTGHDGDASATTGLQS